MLSGKCCSTDVPEILDKSPDGYLDIKPIHETRVKEAQDFWNQYFEDNQFSKSKTIGMDTPKSQDEYANNTLPHQSDVIESNDAEKKPYDYDNSESATEGCIEERNIAGKYETSIEDEIGNNCNDIDINNSDETTEIQAQNKFLKIEISESDRNTYYYDDKGNPYRINNELKPNNIYELNGYKYTTDESGRIVSVEGTLHMKNHEGRLTIKDSLHDIGKGDECDGDDRGHLIGDQFDGSNGLENIVPQDATINRNDFKNFENELAISVKEGKKVNVIIEVNYDGVSRRPDAILVTYNIDDEEYVRIFPNGEEKAA